MISDSSATARRSGRAYISARTALLLLLAVLVAGSLLVRVIGIGWGIPHYDPALMPYTPYRHSYHLDEDNFLFGLAFMKPSLGNFDVGIYQWGTLQFYLIYGALLLGSVVGVVPAPWEAAFLSGNVDALPRIYMLGRSVSVLAGVACTLLVFALGSALAGRRAGLAGGAIYALSPLAVVGAHYLTNDVVMSTLVAASVYCSVRAVQDDDTRRTLFLGLAGLLLGLAISAKYSALFAAPGLVVAQWGAWRTRSRLPAGSPLRRATFLVGLPWVAAMAGFLLGDPYSVLNRGTLPEGLRQAAEGNAIDPALGLGPPLNMLWQQLTYLGSLGLGWPALLLSLIGVALIAAVAVRALAMRKRGEPWLPPVWVPHLVVLAAFGGLVVGLALNRVLVLRYCQPLLPLLAVAGGLAWSLIPQAGLRWAAGALALGVASIITLGQLSLMTGPHPADNLLAWLQSNVRPGQQIARAWPEYPVLDDRKYSLIRVDPWRPDLPPGARPDYIVMDDMKFGPPAPQVSLLLATAYEEAAHFGAQPEIAGIRWDEGATPHDWKYSHPTFTVYRRK